MTTTPRSSWPLRAAAALSAAALALTTTSCMNTYDAYGRPVQSVDPGVAVAGVAAAGLVGYAIANNNDDRRGRHHHHHYGRRNDYRGPYGPPRGYYR